MSQAPDKERSPLSELDNPVWWALAGPQRDLGTTTPMAGRYHPDIAPFGALAPVPTESHWGDLAGLIGSQGTVVLTGDVGGLPPDWTIVREIAAVQMVSDQLHHRSPHTRSSGSLLPHPPKDTPAPLGTDDVSDMLALVAETQPGPFLPRTVEFGGYLGIRRHDRLIAMAGERIRLPGFTEISAVATHPDHRRQGLAEFLIRIIAERIVGRGELPFLHASADNAVAIRLYEVMGFVVRRAVPFLIVQAPETETGDP